MHYTRENEGCYADSAHGHTHLRHVLAELIAEASGPMTLARELEGEMSDDASEEEEAIEWLNVNACDDRVRFGLCDGELLLLSHESWDERAEG